MELVMLEKIQATGVRLLKLRKKLAARDGLPGFKKNCEALRAEIARLEQIPAPSPEQMEKAWEAAEAARKSETDTTSPTKADSDGDDGA
jgi:septal ring factor EnvC (AmiA/AmiB activator)